MNDYPTCPDCGAPLVLEQEIEDQLCSLCAAEWEDEADEPEEHETFRTRLDEDR